MLLFTLFSILRCERTLFYMSEDEFHKFGKAVKAIIKEICKTRVLFYPAYLFRCALESETGIIYFLCARTAFSRFCLLIHFFPVKYFWPKYTLNWFGFAL